LDLGLLGFQLVGKGAVVVVDLVEALELLYVDLLDAVLSARLADERVV
jgi:hypothetical protein